VNGYENLVNLKGKFPIPDNKSLYFAQINCLSVNLYETRGRFIEEESNDNSGYNIYKTKNREKIKQSNLVIYKCKNQYL
jgi:hypothetical protein